MTEQSSRTLPAEARRRDVRHDREIEHGTYLASGGAEVLWGWGTPAGKLRAARRGALILEAARIGPASRVMEIGCGTGLFTEIFAASGARILAVDLSPDLLVAARARHLPRVEFREQPFEECDADGPFDAIIGSSVLHHLDLGRTWPKVRALLKPGGRISFAEPNMLNPQIFCERHFRRLFPQVSPDETAFVRFRLKRDLARAGFTAIEITPFDWLHPATPPAMIPAVRAVGRLLEWVWPVRELAGSVLIRASRPA
jgi:2-polyprenyl-3-methyl-5-hydroxy-6-metoxy-1,4-benzoquinol methylase